MREEEGPPFISIAILKAFCVIHYSDLPHTLDIWSGSYFNICPTLYDTIISSDYPIQ